MSYSKKFFWMLVLITLGYLQAYSVELLTKEQAIKRMFLTAESVTEETVKVSPEQLDQIKKKLGGKLYAIKRSDSSVDNEYTFYNGFKSGEKVGVAIIEEQEDKWGPLSFIILLDPKTGKVKNAAMLKFVDGRARNLSNRNFLKEFFDKGNDDPITIGKDITAVSGATVSSEMLCFIMKKTVALYALLYLN